MLHQLRLDSQLWLLILPQYWSFTISTPQYYSHVTSSCLTPPRTSTWLNSSVRTSGNNTSPGSPTSLSWRVHLPTNYTARPLSKPQRPTIWYTSVMTRNNLSYLRWSSHFGLIPTILRCICISSLSHLDPEEGGRSKASLCTQRLEEQIQLQLHMRASLNKAIHNDCKSSFLPNGTSTFGSLTPEAIINKIIDEWAKPTPMGIEENESKLTQPFDQHCPITELIRHLQRAKLFAIWWGGNKITDAWLIASMLARLEARLLYAEYTKTWNRWSEDHNTRKQCQHFLPSNLQT